eukprot:gene6103-1092_t
MTTPAMDLPDAAAGGDVASLSTATLPLGLAELGDTSTLADEAEEGAGPSSSTPGQVSSRSGPVDALSDEEAPGPAEQTSDQEKGDPPPARPLSASSTSSPDAPDTPPFEEGDSGGGALPARPDSGLSGLSGLSGSSGTSVSGALGSGVDPFLDGAGGANSGIEVVVGDGDDFLGQVPDGLGPWASGSGQHDPPPDVRLLVSPPPGEQSLGTAPTDPADGGDPGMRMLVTPPPGEEGPDGPLVDPFDMPDRSPPSTNSGPRSLLDPSLSSPPGSPHQADSLDSGSSGSYADDGFDPSVHDSRPTTADVTLISVVIHHRSRPITRDNTRPHGSRGSVSFDPMQEEFEGLPRPGSRVSFRNLLDDGTALANSRPGTADDDVLFRVGTQQLKSVGSFFRQINKSTANLRSKMDLMAQSKTNLVTLDAPPDGRPESVVDKATQKRLDKNLNEYFGEAFDEPSSSESARSGSASSSFSSSTSRSGSGSSQSCLPLKVPAPEQAEVLGIVEGMGRPVEEQDHSSDWDERSSPATPTASTPKTIHEVWAAAKVGIAFDLDNLRSLKTAKELAAQQDDMAMSFRSVVKDTQRQNTMAYVNVWDLERWRAHQDAVLEQRRRELASRSSLGSRGSLSSLSSRSPLRLRSSSLANRSVTLGPNLSRSFGTPASEASRNRARSFQTKKADALARGSSPSGSARPEMLGVLSPSRAGTMTPKPGSPSGSQSGVSFKGSRRMGRDRNRSSSFRSGARESAFIVRRREAARRDLIDNRRISENLLDDEGFVLPRISSPSSRAMCSQLYQQDAFARAQSASDGENSSDAGGLGPPDEEHPIWNYPMHTRPVDVIRGGVPLPASYFVNDEEEEEEEAEEGANLELDSHLAGLTAILDMSQPVQDCKGVQLVLHAAYRNLVTDMHVRSPGLLALSELAGDFSPVPAPDAGYRGPAVVDAQSFLLRCKRCAEWLDKVDARDVFSGTGYNHFMCPICGWKLKRVKDKTLRWGAGLISLLGAYTRDNLTKLEEVDVQAEWSEAFETYHNWTEEMKAAAERSRFKAQAEARETTWHERQLAHERGIQLTDLSLLMNEKLFRQQEFRAQRNRLGDKYRVAHQGLLRSQERERAHLRHTLDKWYRYRAQVHAHKSDLKLREDQLSNTWSAISRRWDTHQEQRTWLEKMHDEWVESEKIRTEKEAKRARQVKVAEHSTVRSMTPELDEEEQIQRMGLGKKSLSMRLLMASRGEDVEDTGKHVTHEDEEAVFAREGSLRNVTRHTQSELQARRKLFKDTMVDYLRVEHIDEWSALQTHAWLLRHGFEAEAEVLQDMTGAMIQPMPATDLAYWLGKERAKKLWDALHRPSSSSGITHEPGATSISGQSGIQGFTIGRLRRRVSANAVRDAVTALANEVDEPVPPSKTYMKRPVVPSFEAFRAGREKQRGEHGLSDPCKSPRSQGSSLQDRQRDVMRRESIEPSHFKALQKAHEADSAKGTESVPQQHQYESPSDAETQSSSCPLPDLAA